MYFFVSLVSLFNLMFMSFIHTYVAVFYSLSLLHRIPLYDYHNLFIHSIVCGHFILGLYRIMLL